MKKLPCLLLLIAFMACRPENNSDQQAQFISTPALSVNMEERPEWQYEHLRLYPLLASGDFIRENAAAGELKTLAEAIDTYGFRISEKKPYGRFEDAGAVNNLTVQNKTNEPVFLMGGDIVRGGRQDRVLAEDQIIAARSLKDIPVFCVEQGRWNFEGEEENRDDIAAKQGQVFAFSAYYNVASGDIRNTLASSKDQQEVWDKVSQLTSEYAPGNTTKAYASLESSQDFTQSRDEYLRFFTGKFTELDQMVGIIAVSGNRIIGADVFGHPQLLSRQLSALLHSYATDAVIDGSPVNVDQSRIRQQIKEMNEALQEDSFTRYNGALVHLYAKATDK